MARFGFLGTFPPTRCGIATFTAALATSMTTPRDHSFIVRLVEQDEERTAGDPTLPVVASMRRGDARSRDHAITALNTADVAVIQHEYGIYGGPDGDEVVDVIRRLDVPAIVTMHTVLADPSAHQREVLEQLTSLASATVVMTNAARHLLTDLYGVGSHHVRVIPHGATTVAAVSGTKTTRAAATDEPSAPVVLTWGLLGPGKGIEWGILAMASLGDIEPRPIYRVLGETHPKVLANDGDAYRHHLHQMVHTLGLVSHIHIDDTYLDSEALARAVNGAAVVLLPYDSTNQVTSGVLAEAVAAGKPVVATGFPHAIELLESGAGIVVPHRDASAMSRAIREVLTGPGTAERMARAGTLGAQHTRWTRVGERYRKLAQTLTAHVVA